MRCVESTCRLTDFSVLKWRDYTVHKWFRSFPMDTWGPAVTNMVDGSEPNTLRAVDVPQWMSKSGHVGFTTEMQEWMFSGQGTFRKENGVESITVDQFTLM